LARPEIKMPDGLYRPAARISQGRIVRRFADCCMDTSDGLVHTLDTLMRVNGRRFILDGRWERSVHPFALDVCRSNGMPAWLPLAGIHGEFELCFAVDPRNEDAFLAAASAEGWKPIPIGEVAAGDGVWIKKGEKGEESVPLDSGLIRNLSATVGSDPRNYVSRLLDLARSAGI
jgi:thiamine monophosphate kinase